MKPEIWDTVMGMIELELGFISKEQKEQGIMHRTDQLNGLVALIGIAQNLIVTEREMVELDAREQEIALGILSHEDEDEATEEDETKA